MNKQDYTRELNRLVDRTNDVRACCGRILDQWRYNLADRSFGPAYQDADGVGQTDLDLLVFLSALADRRATINLPVYKSRRAATQTEGEVVLSKENRHGRVIGVRSNKDVFSFSVMIEDANVITASETGKPRTFMVQDLDGTWHDGWKTIEFLPLTDEEKRLFAETPKVAFRYLVHPNRKGSFGRRPYCLAKAAEDRLSDQRRHVVAEIKRIRDELEIEPEPHRKSTTVGGDKRIKVWAFNADLDGFSLKGNYSGFDTTQDGLDEAISLRRRIDELLRTLRFHTRATEYAYWHHQVQPELGDGVLDWLKTGAAKFGSQPGHKVGRTYYAVQELDNGLQLRWRARQKTERVAA